MAVLESAKHVPSPIDAYFGGVYYIGPIFTAFRGTEDAVDYYRELRAEVEERDARWARARSRPTATSARSATASWSRARRTGRTSASSGRCSPTRARSSSPRPTRRSAASTTSASATTRRARSRRSPTTAWAATRTSTCRRASTCSRATCEDYEADGFLINCVKCCNSFSAGQLMILREVEKRTGRPGGFIESDLVDPRYFSRGEHQEPPRVLLPDDRSRSARAEEGA